MYDGGMDTVLFVCNDEVISTDILDKLHSAGFGVVGPTPRAATALALTAQTPPTLALVAGDLTGERSASQLAEDLMSNWGVRSLILRDGTLAHGEPLAHWAVDGEQLERLRRAFGRNDA
ncbi:hypothetical protein AMEJIAPC_03278 [Caulobacter sp. NIBR1757]|nr:hypothetical protein AMEJIAPC_03278 [Caulobacter sp. NIBR1757]